MAHCCGILGHFGYGNLQFGQDSLTSTGCAVLNLMAVAFKTKVLFLLLHFTGIGSQESQGLLQEAFVTFQMIIELLHLQGGENKCHKPEHRLCED